MRIRLWNAFASNNSGSYTIVGRFADTAVAESVANELGEVFEAHDQWVQAQTNQRDGGGQESDPSPLEQFAAKHGMSGHEARNIWEYWPQYSDHTAPRLASAGRDLVIHHPYTISLPAMIGEYIYRRGGRVATELDHAHHPVILRIVVWFDHRMRLTESEVESRMKAMEELLAGPNGVASRYCSAEFLLWRHGEWQSRELVMVPEDLIGATKDIAEAVSREAASMTITVLEADNDEFPLSMFRR